MADFNQPAGSDQADALQWLQPAEGHIRFHWIDLKPNDTLFRKGAKANSVFLIIEGRLKMMPEDQSDAEPVILCAGQLVGEKELITSGQRPATIVADCATRLLRISALEYQRLKKGQGWLG